ncbi:uncharacterized protein TNCV_3810851 [Trichonephila clavipes]|nr:uncharacterized protein TNCV_3810851 [Trichonephila clavipes]
MTNFFIPELNNHDVQELWFQQDGAACHTARATIDLLKDTLGDRLISRFGPVNWPPRSCDLTPLDRKSHGSMRISHKRLTVWKTPFAVLLPIYGHKCWKNSSKIGRPDWTTSEPAVAVLCQKSYLKYDCQSKRSIRKKLRVVLFVMGSSCPYGRSQPELEGFGDKTRQRRTLGENMARQVSLHMLDTSPLRCRDQMCRPIVHMHQ